jgi:hypothetical protein
MPYWKRPGVLLANVESYSRLYSNEDLELVICDDGSGDSLDIPVLPWPWMIVHLPRKDRALNPCVPINRAVVASSGEVVVLTNPEVVHREPILQRMGDYLFALGPRGYVAAACWGGIRRGWYCHSTDMPPDDLTGRAPRPKGAGLHFCAMMRRSLFDEVGGFSEIYRDGQGYEDNDFLWKLHRAGAAFKIADDLVCDHAMCPPCEWPRGGIARNRMIFEAAWPHLTAA